MNYQDLLTHFRRPSDAAKALGLDRRLVNEWKGRRIPSRHQLKAERVTKGILKADAQSHEEANEFVSLLRKGKEARAQ